MPDNEIKVLDPSRGEIEYASPAQAQADFLAGKRTLLSGDAHDLIQDKDGTVASFPSEKVEDALRAGWRFADKSDLLRHDAQNQQGQAALEGAASALSLGTSDLALHAAGVEGLRERQDTTGHGLGTALGTGLMMFGTGGLGGAAEAGAAAVEGAAARNIAQRAISSVLLPARALEATSARIGAAGAEALGELGASQAARSIGGAMLGEGLTNAGVGALGAFSEEQLGNPDANAESLLAAAGMGALIGGGLGGLGGAAIGGIGHALSGAGRAGRPAVVDAEQLGAALAAQGVEVKDQGLLKRAAAFIREDAPGALGFNTDDVRAVNTPAAQRFLREKDAVLKQTATDLDGVVKRVAAQQEGQDSALGTLRPRIIKELIGPAAGGQALSTAGATISDIRAELQSVIDREVALGLGEGGAAKAFRKQLQALDEFEGRLFDEAGVPRAYTERTVHPESGPQFMREPKAAAVPVVPEGASTHTGLPSGTQQELKFGNEAGEGGFFEGDTATGVDRVGANQQSAQRIQKIKEDMTAVQSLIPGDVQDHISNWSGSGYDYIRPIDAGTAKGTEFAREFPKLKEAADALNQAVHKYGQSVDVPLFRGVTFKKADGEAIIGALRKSGEWNEPALHAWSWNPSTADNFAHLGTGPDQLGILFRIAPDAKIKGFPASISESELVAAKGAYRVKDISQQSDGTYQVLLEPKSGKAAKGAPSASVDPPDSRQLTLDSALPKAEPKTVQVPVDPNAPPTDALGSLGNRSVQQVKRWSLADLGDRFVLPDAMASRTFDGLEQLRQAVTKLPRGADPEVKAALERVQDRLGQALTDRNAFGKAAEMQERMSAALKARNEAWADLQQHYDVANPGAAQTYMDRLTSLKGDAAKDALDRWVSANQTVGEVADKYYTGNEFGHKARAVAADYAKVSNQMRDKVSVMNALTRLRNQERVQHWGGGGALQYALQGAGMAAGSALGLPGVASTLAAGALVGSIMNPGSHAVTRANMAAVRERVGKALQGLADQAMTKVAAGAHTAGLEAPGLARTVAVSTRAMLDAKTDRDRQKAFDRRLQELQTLQDPQAFLDHSTNSFGDLASAAPNHTTAMQLKAQTAIQLLASKLPGARAGTGGLLGGAPQPTAADLLRFALTDRAVQDPLGTLHAAVQRGMLLPAEREALQTVHPQLTQSFQQALAERAEPGKLDARAVRLMTSFLGQQDGTMAWVQQAHQDAAQPAQKPAGGTKPRPAPRGLAAPSDTLGAP